MTIKMWHYLGIALRSGGVVVRNNTMQGVMLRVLDLGLTC